MRVGIRLVFALRVCTAILLGLMVIAMVSPPGDVALGQTSTGSISFTFTTIDHPNAYWTGLIGINNTGQIVGNFQNASGTHVFLTDVGGTTFTTIDPPQSALPNSTAARGINDAGQIVGTFMNNTFPSTHGFLWVGGAYTTIDVPNATGAIASGINNAGQIVGSFFDRVDINEHGYLYTGGKFTTIDFPIPPAAVAARATELTIPSGINNAGLIAGEYTYSYLGCSATDPACNFTHSFLEAAGGTPTTIDPPNTNGSRAFGVNDAGQIVGFSGGDGFLRDAGGTFTTIHVPNSSFTYPSGINNNSLIVGSYVDAGGVSHGFLAKTAVPVIVLPGVPGSWTPSIRNTLVKGGIVNIPALALDLVSMFRTHLPYTQMAVDAAYDDLLNTLASKGIPVFAMPYDWAKGGYQGAAADLDQFIRDHNFAKVDIIAHSAGGLVALQYIQNRLSASADPHVRNLILLGGINEGTLVAHCAYYVDSVACLNVDKAWKLLLDTLLQVLESKDLRIALANTIALEVAQATDTIAEAMPIFPYLQNVLLPNSPLFVQYNNAYLQSLRQQILSGVGQFQGTPITAYTVRGTGVPTPKIFHVVLNLDPTTFFLRPYKVLSTNTEFDLNGDGSTLAQSATLPGINDVPVPNATHLEGLFNCTKDAYPRLRDAGTLACGPQVRSPSSYVEIHTGSPVRIRLTDPQGRLTGTNFTTGTDVADIPTSTFFESDNPGIFIGQAIQGTYALDVLGIGSGGPYELDIAFPNAFPNDFDIMVKSFSGSIAPGQTLGFTFDTFAFQGVTNLFATFGGNLAISPSFQAFGGDGTFTLGPGGTISPVIQPVTIQIGNGFLATIPAGSFQQTPQGTFVFGGVIQGVLLAATLTPTGGTSYAFAIAGAGAPNLPSTNPVTLRLAIGSYAGSTPVNATFVP